MKPSDDILGTHRPLAARPGAYPLLGLGFGADLARIKHGRLIRFHELGIEQLSTGAQESDSMSKDPCSRIVSPSCPSKVAGDSCPTRHRMPLCSIKSLHSASDRAADRWIEAELKST